MKTLLKEELLQKLKCRQYQSVLKLEIALYAHTHRQLKIQQPELFQINGISLKEMLENLLIFLTNEQKNTLIRIPRLQISTLKLANCLLHVAGKQ